MSRLQSTHRLSLFAGSSLAAAALLGVLTPTAVFAANECGNPGANAAAADALTCATPPTYATGVDYSATANGDLTVILQNRFDTGTTGTGGILMSGNAGEDMTLIREDNPAGAGDPRIVNTAGRAIDLSTQGDGNVLINLTDGDPTSETSTNPTTGTAPVRITGSSDAVRARALGSGNVSVIFAPTGSLSHPLAEISAGAEIGSGGSGILARSTSGAINIDSGAANISVNTTNGGAGIDAEATAAGNITINAGHVSGRLYGIRAATTGSGDITMNLGAVFGNVRARQTAAVDVTTGSGEFTLNMTAGEIVGQGNAGAIRGVFGGDATLNFNIALADSRTVWAVDLTNAVGTLTTVNANSILGTRDIQEADNDRLTLRGRGGGDFVVNLAAEVVSAFGAGNFRGLADFSGATGDVDLNLAEGVGWSFRGRSRFGSGDDTLTIGDGALVQNGRGDLTIDFGDGADVLSSAGFLLVGSEPFSGVAGQIPPTMTLENLEAFNNSGLIILGAPGSGTSYSPAEDGGDGTPRAILSMPGVAFTGSGDSRILLDVDLNSTGQAACDPALRDARGFMPGADCIALQGGATAGVTRVVINDMVPGDRGAYNKTGIVLVDVSGGTGASGDFVIDSASTGYSAAFDGVIDKGLYLYPLVYDAGAQQFKLVSVVGQNALQFPLLAGAVQNLWRTSTGTWFERQADVRGGIDEGLGGGVWLRASGENVDRTVIQTVEGAGNVFEFDNSFEQTSYAVNGGVDLMSASSADTAFVVGLMAGYAHADIEYSSSPNIGRIDGWSAGLYGSFLAGGLFIDAAVNANKLTMDNDVPDLNLFPSGTILSTDLVSLGGQVEAGWRFPILDGAFIEPLAAVSYVRTKYEDMQVPADDPARERIFVMYDDPTSLRGALGARLGLGQDYGVVRTEYSLLGRVWNEFEDGNSVVFQGPGDDAFATDQFTGQISEIGVGASIYGADGIVSGFLNLGGKFGDDYEAKVGSAGVRVAW